MVGRGRRQRRVRVSILHEKGDVIARAVTLTSNELQRIGRITERWSDERRWTLLLTRLLRRRLGGKWLPGLPEVSPRTCSADENKPRDRSHYALSQAPDHQVQDSRAHFFG